MRHTKSIFRRIGAFILIYTCLSSLSYGQRNESVLFKAMQDEMDRTKKELTLPNAPSTHFIGYTVAENAFLSVSSTLGTVTYTKESPRERIHSVNLYVGDSQFSSDYSYTDNGINLNYFTSRDDNYDQLRRNFWQTSDVAYKFAVEVYKSKKNAVKTATISEEEKALPDMLPLTGTVVSTPAIPEFYMNKKAYQELACKLSKVFEKYPSIFGSKIDIDGIQTVYYYLTTEGTKIKEPACYISIGIIGSVRNDLGQVVDDQKKIYAKSFDKLPAESELISCVESFAERLTSLVKAPNIHEYYLGPVLFEEAASAKIFADNLIAPSGIVAFRQPFQVMASAARSENVGDAKNVKPLEDRIGKKVIDNRLNVQNRTDLTEFEGMSLIGNYTLDAQGVVPVKEIKLVENGILKSLLSSRVPTKKVKGSTGSLRYGVTPRAITKAVAPGTLVVSAPGGASSSELKSQLIKAAVEEGLDYAYIVRTFADETDQYLYKVSVKDGSETLVTGAEISPIQFIKLKRVLGVSKDEMAFNYLYKGSIPTSIIAPKSVLIEDIEIMNKPMNVQKESPLIAK